MMFDSDSRDKLLEAYANEVCIVQMCMYIRTLLSTSVSLYIYILGNAVHVCYYLKVCDLINYSECTVYM